MDCRLIAFDLDGTLLNDDKKVSELNREAMEAASGRGVTLALASGRVRNSLPREVTEIGVVKYAVTSNGARVSNLITGELLHASFLSVRAVERVLELIDRDGLYTEVFCDGQAYIEDGLFRKIVSGEAFPERSEYVRRTRLPVDDIRRLLAERREVIENINFIFDGLDMREAYMETMLTIPEATVTNSMPNNYELVGLKTSKREGVNVLAELLDIERENIMCFGDAPNDIPMLEYAGLGVAMENAMGDTKEHADYICESNNDSGVGKTIAKFVLRDR